MEIEGNEGGNLRKLREIAGNGGKFMEIEGNKRNGGK